MTGRILVVDAVPTNRIILRVKLAAAFYEVTLASNGRDALRSFRRARQDMVIAAVDLPDISGRELVGQLRQAAGDPRLPIMLMHHDDDISERLASLAAGADDVLSKPLDELVMLARLRSLLRARDAEAELQLRDDTSRALGLAEQAGEFDAPALVRLVSSGPTDALQSLARDLKTRISDRIEIAGMDEALCVSKAVPDVVVVAEDTSSGGEGLALLPQLRSNRAFRNAALIYVARPEQRQEAASALDIGASDLLSAGPEPDELALRLRKQIARKRVNDRLRDNMRDGLKAAVSDPLTGLYNRRYALPHVTRLAQRAAKQGREYALLVLDLDHFKSVNDTYGHAAGDLVLQSFAQILTDNLRAADLVARLGGEEFLIAIPDTNREKARKTAERICRLLEARPITLANGTGINVTVSIGIAMGRGETEDEPQILLDRADKALYAAKDKGRNTVMLADNVALMDKRPGLLRPAPTSLNEGAQRRA